MRIQEVSRKKGLLFAAIFAAAFSASAAVGMAAIGSGERHDDRTAVQSSDRGAVIDRLAKDIPVPSGGGFDLLRDGAYVEDESSLAGTMAFVAACQWAASWLDGGEEARGQAEAVLHEVPEWPQLVAVAGQSTLDYLARVADAAQRGDSQFVQSWHDANAC